MFVIGEELLFTYICTDRQKSSSLYNSDSDLVWRGDPNLFFLIYTILSNSLLFGINLVSV